MDIKLVKDIKEGKLTPEQALDAFENPAKKLTDFPSDRLVINTLDCGFPSLNDRDIFKIGEGELVIAAARPSMGKSAFIFQIGRYVAQTAPVIVFSCEMSHRMIMQRMVAINTGLGLNNIRRGKAAPHAIDNAYTELDKLDLLVDCRTGLDIQTIKSTCRTYAKKKKFALIVVDYLQIVGNTSSMQNRALEVGNIAKELRDLAIEMGCPLLTAAQVNRDCLVRGFESLRTGTRDVDFMPALGEMAESSKIENHADSVIGICREEAITSNRKGVADIQILKNRAGELGRFEFKFLGASTKFVDPKEERI